MLKIHSSITAKVIRDACRREMFGTDNPGFCIACGAEHFHCEPDARNYTCEECLEPAVFGAMELLLETVA